MDHEARGDASLTVPACCVGAQTKIYRGRPLARRKTDRHVGNFAAPAFRGRPARHGALVRGCMWGALGGHNEYIERTLSTLIPLVSMSFWSLYSKLVRIEQHSLDGDWKPDVWLCEGPAWLWKRSIRESCIGCSVAAFQAMLQAKWSL